MLEHVRGARAGWSLSRDGLQGAGHIMSGCTGGFTRSCCKKDTKDRHPRGCMHFWSNTPRKGAEWTMPGLTHDAFHPTCWTTPGGQFRMLAARK